MKERRLTQVGFVAGKSLRALSTLTAQLHLRFLGADIASTTRMYGLPIVSIEPGSQLILMNRVVLISASRHNPLGLAHAVVLRTLAPGAILRIREDVGLSGASVSAACEVDIGERTLVGADAIITDTNFHPLDPTNRRYAPLPDPRSSQAVHIGRDVFIGARAIILPGTRIGDGAVVAAGCVVRGDIPANTIVAGNPGRVVSNIGSTET